MPFLQSIAGLVQDPPPNHVFELSESGLAFFIHSGARDKEAGFEPFAPGTLVVSPVENNVLSPEIVSSVLQKIAPANGSKKRRRAALILPDYAARVSVLDFDSFPSSPEERNSLVRFRVKKTIPFDIDSAAVSYYVQPGANSKKIDVVAVTVALEVIARYEALFRAAGFHPGAVTTSTLAALNLYNGDGVAVFAKLSGCVLTAAVLSEKAIELFRCVMLEKASEDEILSVLHPTFAYVEDELNAPVGKLILCGFAEPPSGLKCEIEPLRSRFGAPNGNNAGLYGFLESAEN